MILFPYSRYLLVHRQNILCSTVRKHDRNKLECNLLETIAAGEFCKNEDTLSAATAYGLMRMRAHHVHPRMRPTQRSYAYVDRGMPIILTDLKIVPALFLLICFSMPIVPKMLA